MNDIYLNNKYTKLYYKIIDRASTRILDPSVYSEKHHVIPECFFINRKRKGPLGWLQGDPDDPKNIVSLTAKEHYICHVLLTKMTEGKGKSKMWIGLRWILIGKSKNHNRNYKITSKIYEKVKIECANIFSNNAKIQHTGKTRSQETKDKISNALTGKKKSPEHAAKNRQAQINRNYKHSPEIIELIRQNSLKQIVTDETRIKISKATLGKKKKPWSDERRTKQPSQKGIRKRSYTCPHCGKLGNGPAMMKWHFDACRLKTS